MSVSRQLLKADLHVHTEYSMDCDMSLEQIISRCLKIGINCLAITDHGTAEGALKMREIAPFKIIVGQEILTPHGEMIGLFLRETVPNGLSIDETIARIRSQGGLVDIPHPFDHLKLALLRSVPLDGILDKVDIIEVLNARSILSRDSVIAQNTAKKYGLAASAGSDAHIPSEIGHVCVEMPDFNTSAEFLVSLAQGKILGHRSSPMVHLASTWMKIKKRF